MPIDYVPRIAAMAEARRKRNLARNRLRAAEEEQRAAAIALKKADALLRERSADLHRRTD